MIQTRHNKRRKGFTLIELLIVILIVSMVYMLGFSPIENESTQAKALSPLNLKSTLLSNEGIAEQLTLLCVDKCKTCLLRQGLLSPYQAYESAIDLSDIKSYTVDASDSLVKIEYERYKDKPICLKMDFYPNGSSTQIILKNKKGSYFLPTFFDEPKQFSSVEDAKEYWLNNAQLVSNDGEFY
jgi:prepilin-type N-terminal cleavage/methylation domain-containing protein